MKRGRKAGFQMSEAHRERIKNSSILNALIEHACGKRKMSSTQVTAGLGLLRKVLPDLQAVTHDGEVNHVISAEPMSENEWSERYGADLETAARPAEKLN